MDNAEKQARLSEDVHRGREGMREMRLESRNVVDQENTIRVTVNVDIK